MAVVKGRGLWNRTSAPQTAVVMLAHPLPLLWRSYSPAWTCPPAVDHRTEWIEMLRPQASCSLPAPETALRSGLASWLRVHS